MIYFAMPQHQQQCTMSCTSKHFLSNLPDMTHALTNPAMLRWARSRADLTVERIALALHVKPGQVQAWEDGSEHPTFKQAQSFANACHVAFGFLFLQKPPEETLPFPDLRTVGGVPPAKPSLDLMDTIKDVLRKQDWYLDYIKDQGNEPLDYIGRFPIDSPPQIIAEDIRHVLGVDKTPKKRTDDAYITELVNAAERSGILVMRSGIVNGNTHRKLDVSEFRGFAIADRHAPVVFINSADAPAARVFTLLHEIAHLWIGSSGLSNVSAGNSRKEEILCNAVAGEFLVPKDEFISHWNDSIYWMDNLAPLASLFNVSRLVIGRRATDLGLIDRELYYHFYLSELKRHRDKESGRGDYYATTGAKNSKALSRAIVAETLSGRLLLRDAGRLLGIQPSKIKTYASKIST